MELFTPFDLFGYWETPTSSERAESVVQSSSLPAEPRPGPATPEEEVAIARDPRLEFPAWLSVTPLALDDPGEPGGAIAHTGDDAGIPVSILRP